MSRISETISILEKYWGHQTFRDPQDKIIDAVLNKQDVLAVLPTGAGKSICYQVPALVFGGVTLVISPLIALMNDQVEQLKKRNVNAFYLHSGLQKSAQEDIIGQIQKLDYVLLYISPEKLASEWFQERISSLDVKFVAIDEAHCISQWGFDFRPEYLKIAKSIEQIDCPKIAVTATATDDVKKDIVEKLQLNTPKIFATSIYRDNLVYKTIVSDDKDSALLRVIHYLEGSSIIYVRSRKACHELSEICLKAGVNNVVYHAGLTREQRNQSQISWMSNKVPLVIATNAFGMGIDKDDVRNVVHFGAPESLEAYYQEAGRAGRDGLGSVVTLISSPKDKQRASKQIQRTYQSEENITKVFQALCNQLQIAEGYMLEGFRLLDILGISKRTELELIDVHYSLKILDLSGVIQYQQDYFTPSKIEVLVAPQTLFSLYETNQTLEDVMKAIVRIYGAQIYEDEVVINLESVARMSDVGQETLGKVLLYLHQRKVIRYFKGTDAPVVKFLMPRPPINKIPIDRKLIDFLKERAVKQLEEMYNYISSTSCKQAVLSKYFGNIDLLACGKCSSCRELNWDLSDKILDLFRHKNTYDLEEIKDAFPTSSYKELSQMLVFLIDSKKIVKLREDVFCLVKR